MEDATGIVMATYKEAVPFLNNTGFNQLAAKPFPVYGKNGLFLIISGIGKTCSAVATSYFISVYGLKRLFNLGAAGSTTEDYTIGDILHIGKSIEYDWRDSGEPRHKIFTPDLLDGFPTATLSTHDVPIITAEARNRAAEISHLVDMEGSAFIQASQAYGRKAYLFKIISDTPAVTDGAGIIENMKITRDALYTFFMERVMGGDAG